jgi:hypothetical protein
VAAEVNVGMSRDEFVALIRTCLHKGAANDCARLYVNGRTRAGQEFGSYCDWEFDKLPPADQVESAELNVDDDQGRDLIIALGPGGVVTELRLESDSVWQELRYTLARGTGWSGWRSLVRDRHQCFESIVREF